MRLEGWDFNDHMIADCVDILEALNSTPDYTAFKENRLVHKAVTYSLLNLGELMKTFSENERNNHPDIPWRRIIGFRDRAAHGYHNLDLEIIWELSQTLISPMLDILNQQKAEMESE